MSKKQLVLIFVSSCVEAAARKVGCGTRDMYLRMKRVGLIHRFILPSYDVLHTQSREQVTDDVLNALQLWEQKLGIESYPVTAYVE